jgi:hypothetical protein
VSLSDKIAAARAKAEATLDPLDWAKLRALEGAETAERYTPPAPGDTTGIAPWTEVSRPESPNAPAD